MQDKNAVTYSVLLRHAITVFLMVAGLQET